MDVFFHEMQTPPQSVDISFKFRHNFRLHAAEVFQLLSQPPTVPIGHLLG